MGERRYTLSELDGMRAYLRGRTVTVMVDPFDANRLYDPDEPIERPYPVDVPISHAEAEEQLRTAMLGGVDPSEMMSADAAKEE